MYNAYSFTRKIMSAIAVLFLLSLCQTHGQQHSDDDVAKQNAALLENAREKARASVKIHLYIIEQLPERELDRYAEFLQLTDKQQSFLDTLYARYKEKDDALRRRQLPVLNAWSGDLAAAGATVAQQGLAAAQNRQELIKARGQLMSRSKMLEDELFYTLEQLLTSDQRKRFWQVLQRRVRSRASEHGLDYRGGKVDLVKLLNAIDDQSDLTVTDPEGYRTLLESYDFTATVFFKRQAKDWLEAWIRGPLILASMRSGLNRSDPAYEAELQNALNKRERLYQESVESAKQIVELNEQYLSGISLVLSESDVRRLRSMYFRKVYPQVYPIRQDVTTQLREAMLLDSLTEQNRLSIETLFNNYIPLRDQLSREMISELRKFRERIAGRLTISHTYQRNMHVKLNRLKSENSILAQNVLSQLRGFLSKDQWSSLKERVDFPEFKNPPANIADLKRPENNYAEMKRKRLEQMGVPYKKK